MWLHRLADAVEKHKGIGKLVSLLEPTMNDEVSAEAAHALSVLASGNEKNQEKIAAAGGSATELA